MHRLGIQRKYRNTACLSLALLDQFHYTVKCLAEGIVNGFCRLAFFISFVETWMGLNVETHNNLGKNHVDIQLVFAKRSTWINLLQGLKTLNMFSNLTLGDWIGWSFCLLPTLPSRVQMYKGRP